jgi:hypothetical protein
MKPVSHLNEDLPGIVEMKSAESGAVVDQRMAQRDI